MNFANFRRMQIGHSWRSECRVQCASLIAPILGGIKEGAGLTDLLWSARTSDKSQAIRSYLVARGLEQYEAAIAMAIPEVVERYTEVIRKELDRNNGDLESDDPKKRAAAFKKLGALEENYMQGMKKAAKKYENKK